jgi:hypothetical protein
MADRFKILVSMLLDRDRRRAGDLGARRSGMRPLLQPGMTPPLESGSIARK